MGLLTLPIPAVPLQVYHVWGSLALLFYSAQQLRRKTSPLIHNSPRRGP